MLSKIVYLRKSTHEIPCMKKTWPIVLIFFTTVNLYARFLPAGCCITSYPDLKNIYENIFSSYEIGYFTEHAIYMAYTTNNIDRSVRAYYFNGDGITDSIVTYSNQNRKLPDKVLFTYNEKIKLVECNIYYHSHHYKKTINYNQEGEIIKYDYSISYKYKKKNYTSFKESIQLLKKTESMYIYRDSLSGSTYYYDHSLNFIKSESKNRIDSVYSEILLDSGYTEYYVYKMKEDTAFHICMKKTFNAKKQLMMLERYGTLYEKEMYSYNYYGEQVLLQSQQNHVTCYNSLGLKEFDLIILNPTHPFSHKKHDTFITNYWYVLNSKDFTYPIKKNKRYHR